MVQYILVDRSNFLGQEQEDEEVMEGKAVHYNMDYLLGGEDDNRKLGKLLFLDYYDEEVSDFDSHSNQFDDHREKSVECGEG
jgi:hypothetical protein